MRNLSKYTAITNFLCFVAITSCQPVGAVETQSQAIGEGHPRDPRADRFRQRRAVLEAAARAVVPRRGRAPSEYWYVVSAITIDAMSAGTFAGFDLDNNCTQVNGNSGCGVRDLSSDLDYDQNTGSCAPGANCQGCVDNAAPVIADILSSSERFDVRSALSAGMLVGKAVWLLRLVAVEDLNNDPQVLLALYRGYSVDAQCAHLFDGGGRFVVSNTSLWTARDVNSPKYFGEGSIRGRRFDIRFGAAGPQSETGEVAWSEFSDLAEPLALKTYQLHLRATLDADGLSATLGNAGTWARAEEFREAMSRGFPQARPAMDAIVPRAADLPLNGRCGGLFGEPVGAVGLGLRYSLARATVMGTSAAPPEDSCGSPVDRHDEHEDDDHEREHDRDRDHGDNRH